MNQNFPPRRPPPKAPLQVRGQAPMRGGQPPMEVRPAHVIMAILNQSQKRYAAVGEMIRDEDDYFRRLDSESNKIAQMMMIEQEQMGGEGKNPQLDFALYALNISLQAAKNAGLIVRQHLEEQLQVELHLQAQSTRWLRGQKPIETAAPDIAPPVTTPPAPPQVAQLTQGSPPPAPQTAYGMQPPQGLPQTPVAGHYFGPFPGAPAEPAFQPAPPMEHGPVQHMPVNTLPVQQVPTDPNQMTSMPAPIATQHFPTAEAAQAVIGAPPQNMIAQPPVVQFQSPEQAKEVVAQSHANNIPASSVPQVNGQPQKPAS